MNRKELKSIIRKIDLHYGLGRLEMLLSTNWFNPFLTLWVNFRSFPFSQACKLPLFVYGRPRIYALSGSMRVIGKVRPGMITFNQCKPGAPSVMSLQSEIYNAGEIIFNGKGYIGTGTKIRTAPNAILSLGKDFKIADMCNIGCFTKVIVGDHSRVAHRCQIMDSNYHYIANFGKGIVPNFKKCISIGKGCWICNTTTITGGAVLPDYTIVASNSLVGRDLSEISSGSLVGGIPVKFIATGFRRVENAEISVRITHFYRLEPDGMFKISEGFLPDDCSLN